MLRRLRDAAGLVLLLLGAAGATGGDSVTEFLGRHWRRPLAPQGDAPARFSPVEASLHPEACGTCHPIQLADWRTSLHAASMGPGVAGQIVEMLATDPASALGCLGCHAPLAEQAPLAGRIDALVDNPVHDRALGGKGVVCAACHVREHERFGPPRRDGSLTARAPRDTLPHAGVTRTPAFLASGFCRSCHQFQPDGLALNGKLLEDTYDEWQASRFARSNVHCQDCHMPDRRHLWRGIHDRDMVRGGVTITPRVRMERPGPARLVNVSLTLRNTRVGHAFPTYIPPRVVMRVELRDAAGVPVPGGVEEYTIGRDVSLDMAQELSDTRVRPGQTATVHLRRQVDQRGSSVRATVTVYPDAFYTRFFETLLEQGAGRGEPLIRRALEATRRSSFTIYEQEWPVR